jgi:hypothetical protein
MQTSEYISSTTLGEYRVPRERYMVSIPGTIPSNKDVASSSTPPTTITTPQGRAMRWLSGIVLSAKMMTAAVSNQAKPAAVSN